MSLLRLPALYRSRSGNSVAMFETSALLCTCRIGNSIPPSMAFPGANGGLGFFETGEVYSQRELQRMED